MASTITSADLKVQITETCELNGKDQGGTYIQTISGINETVKRIVTVSTTEMGLIGMGTAISTDLGLSHVAGVFDEDDVRYMRITNLDDENFIELIFRDEDSTEFAIKLDAGYSFLYSAGSAGVVDTMHAAGSAITVSLNDLVDITGKANSANCDVEVFVASV